MTLNKLTKDMLKLAIGFILCSVLVLGAAAISKGNPFVMGTFMLASILIFALICLRIEASVDKTPVNYHSEAADMLRHTNGTPIKRHYNTEVEPDHKPLITFDGNKPKLITVVNNHLNDSKQIENSLQSAIDSLTRQELDDINDESAKYAAFGGNAMVQSDTKSVLNDLDYVTDKVNKQIANDNITDINNVIKKPRKPRTTKPKVDKK